MPGLFGLRGSRVECRSLRQAVRIFPVPARVRIRLSLHPFPVSTGLVFVEKKTIPVRIQLFETIPPRVESVAVAHEEDVVDDHVGLGLTAGPGHVPQMLQQRVQLSTGVSSSVGETVLHCDMTLSLIHI